ncbi:MAG: hypothetical protein KA267_04475 [Gemmatimonadales bacterium]|jgi:hypothetical protein|nr:hypothetical protein [Gemmatimonadales bacterium]MBP6569871.1 hypothetical protein [Gemmatimonadales bacterium]MBP7619532.1 hypothetical protein [Gemmatimonadales bacterium]MBP9897347.1 hypothetical protein [Gemmatimonadales bacterium]
MRLPLLFALLVGLPAAARGQDRPTLDDSLLRSYAQATPCPAQPPAAWLKGDSAIARKPTCTVVAMAAARLAADPDPVVRALGVSPTCVSSIGMSGWGQPTPMYRTDQPAQRVSSGPREYFAFWGVTFIDNDSNSVYVSVNRFNGAVSHRTRAIDARNPAPKACQR